jgi:hypothetical protein
VNQTTADFDLVLVRIASSVRIRSEGACESRLRLSVAMQADNNPNKVSKSLPLVESFLINT